mmetsp:Transcript_17152/g.35549  ORF Transcript_17152/g.35549 Transcript_17152/m.35549 type:complete len:82 (+) Transcript_17152:62-307(+)
MTCGMRVVDEEHVEDGVRAVKRPDWWITMAAVVDGFVGFNDKGDVIAAIIVVVLVVVLVLAILTIARSVKGLTANVWTGML